MYIPLGGNRKHVYLNLSIVFILTGIWHGASWTFILWGIWNLIFILLERRFGIKGPVFLRKIYTLFVVNLGWVLFRAPSVAQAWQFVETMFGITAPEMPGFTPFWYLDRWTLTIMVIAIVFASSVPTRIKGVLADKLPAVAVDICKYAALVFLLYMSMLRIVSGTYNPFIYFQF